MDKIWDRKSFRSQRSLAVVAGMKKTNDHARTDKSRTLKKKKRDKYHAHLNVGENTL